MGWEDADGSVSDDDRRFLSHACLEPKVERDQDGLHLIIPYQNKTSLRLVFSPTVRLHSQ